MRQRFRRGYRVEAFVHSALLPVRKNALDEQFAFKNDQFTKTGSGQTQEKSEKVASFNAG